MVLSLSDLIPTNLAEEKSKFFAQNFQYNPQFNYKKKIDTSNEVFTEDLHRSYQPLARHILKNFHLGYYQEEAAPRLSQPAVEKQIYSYLQQYQLEKRYHISFSEHFISQISVNLKEKCVKVRLPLKFSAIALQRALHHEIGTHLLRQQNYEQQIWYKKRRSFGLRDHMRTEEGLAAIHGLLERDDLHNYKSAFNYLAVGVAQRGSFVETFQFFQQYFLDPEVCFYSTFKKKRGFTDTSLPGAYTKGSSYFEGFIDVLHFLKHHDFDPTILYFGKFAFEDSKKVERLSPNFQPILPKFYQDDPQTYRHRVQKMAKVNLGWRYYL